jgi:hypothetical protein
MRAAAAASEILGSPDAAGRPLGCARGDRVWPIRRFAVGKRCPDPIWREGRGSFGVASYGVGGLGSRRPLTSARIAIILDMLDSTNSPDMAKATSW